ncbi:MAG: bifunctional UDP-N-acetylglucosamine diphosphorylase/glucosamine-1-phosphate N-acetyltransferase GlmU [Bacillota bacterium]|nr:bifunctional UDP-N-acetylglucosamine diphosphorylase/glucosamine-1-phosphate N-acetyltransferase GlmU [Bacillota bacterium]
MGGDFSCVILAAGQGTRMKSDRPKVLHPVGGRPMLLHVLRAVWEAGCHDPVVVVGHGGEMVRSLVAQSSFSAARFAVQERQLGTGHAVLQAKGVLPEAGTVLVVCGDTPLLRPATLRALVEEHRRGGFAATVLTAHLNDPTGYGRVVRGPDSCLERIVEEKDATPEERAIKEINAGIYAFELAYLWPALERITPNNAQGEYYLTDVIGLLRAAGKAVGTLFCPDPQEILGVNSRRQLAGVEAVLRRRKAEDLMETGVTIVDPNATYIDVDVTVGRDTVIFPFTFLEGETVVGERCIIGPQCRIVDSRLGDEVQIQYSLVYESTLGRGVRVGPFAYLRPQTEVAEGAKIGDFVELKKARIGPGSKVPHHSYVGDAVVGAGVNIGAGTITCNYDGREKHQTVIEDEVFVGSNTNLVAPVRVGRGAYIAAGSTITRDVPPYSLGIGRARQSILEGWVKKRRDRERE